MGSRIGVGFTSTALPTYPIKEPFKRSQIKGRHGGLSVWFLVGNGGMDYGDDYWGLLSTRQMSDLVVTHRHHSSSFWGCIFRIR